MIRSENNYVINTNMCYSKELGDIFFGDTKSEKLCNVISCIILLKVSIVIMVRYIFQ